MIINPIKNKEEKNRAALSSEFRANCKKSNAKIIINLEPVLADCYNDITMLKELIRLFEKNIQEFLRKAKLGIAEENFLEVSNVAHKIKTGLVMLKRLELREIILLMEKCCKEKNLELLKGFYRKFTEMYLIVQSAIHKDLIRLSSISK